MRLKAWGVVSMSAALGSAGPIAAAQTPNPENATIDAIRGLLQIGDLDQGRIKRWVRIEVDRLAEDASPTFRSSAFQAFRDTCSGQYRNPRNTQPFQSQFATQMGAVANGEFAKRGLDITVSRGLARVLVDLNASETIPGLAAAIGSQDQATRFLGVKGLTAQRKAIGADQTLFTRVIALLRDAATSETDAVVLGQLYRSMAFPKQAASIIDAYLAVFDRRLAHRRGPAVAADGAELDAFEFFRTDGVLNQLNDDQKKALVARLAVFLRLDAERYSDPAIAPPGEASAQDPDFYERDRIERSLDAVESILETVVGKGKGGTVRIVLNAQGYDGRVAVSKEAYRWVGDVNGNTRGALNEPPWDVPVGAP